MEQEQRVLKNGKKLSVYIDNFEENINEDDIELGEVGGVEWELKLNTFSENGVDYLSIQGRSDFEMVVDIWPERLSTEMAICVKNERLDRWEKCQGRFEVEENEWIGWEKFMRMDSILDPDSGFLRDGSLMIQVEIRVDYITDRDGNRIFNLFDPFKGSVLFENNYVNFYVSKQMLILHSPVLAEQLAAGRGEVVTPDEISCESLHVFLHLIHGVKIGDARYRILPVLYLAHKYQVLTVLRQLEVKIKGFSDKEINCVKPYSNVFWWTERVLGKNQFDDFQKLINANLGWNVEISEELTALKRKFLLAITRASFTHDLDPPKPEPEPLPVPIPSSFLHNLFKSIKTISGCL